LKIEKWVVFGGSWGSTLSLAYAETHPSRVKALILRGIFTLRRKELIWFYQDGASFIYPDHWENYLAPIPEAERGDLIFAYHRRLTGNDENEKLKCAKAWTTWEMATSRLYVDPKYLARGEDDQFAIAFARFAQSHLHLPAFF
jgi:proline iminopeptidase